MSFLRSRPFLCLAIVTILIGVLWHSPLIGPGAMRDALAGGVSVIGAPFIGAMRLSTSLLDGSRLTPLLGLGLGLAPYLLADWLLRRYRTRTRPTSEAA